MKKEMTGRERFATGTGAVIGGAGLIIITHQILTRAKVDSFPMMGLVFLIIIGGGAAPGRDINHQVRGYRTGTVVP